VLPFQGCGSNNLLTQGGGNARTARVSLPWAGLFWPFQGNRELTNREVQTTRRIQTEFSTCNFNAHTIFV